MLLSVHPLPMDDEDIAMNTTPGSGENEETQNDTCVQITRCQEAAASCCKDHRKLAISSIICGISCIGIVALIDSVKAQEAHNPEKAQHFSHRARKFAIISIVVWLLILFLTPVLLVLVSYLLTLID